MDIFWELLGDITPKQRGQQSEYDESPKPAAVDFPCKLLFDFTKCVSELKLVHLYFSITTKNCGIIAAASAADASLCQESEGCNISGGAGHYIWFLQKPITPLQSWHSNFCA